MVSAVKASCSNAARYQGKLPPRCNGGAGCERCLAKYATIQGAAAAATVERMATPTLDVVAARNGDLTIHYEGPVIRTPEELIADAKIDTRLWEVERTEVNNWPVAGKLNQGQDEKGNWKGEALWQQSLRQIKVVLRRRAPRKFQEAIDALLNGWTPRALADPKRAKSRRGVPHMAEFAMHDAHFGKRAWEAQTGADFDVEIITADFCGAVDDLTDRLSPYNVEKVVIVVGSDFFQVNNWLGTTARGTVVDSVDDRFTKVFEAGFRSMEYKIRRAREIADVEVLYVGGNHDPETSYYLSRVLAERFRDDPYVKFDMGPQERKYIGYGPVALGITHGDDIDLKRLPLVMATEAPDLWANAWHREIHTGHLHKKKKLDFISADEEGGVVVRILPSMSGTDHWHFKKGFVNNGRAAEVYLWSLEDGYAGHLSVNARSFKVAQESRLALRAASAARGVGRGGKGAAGRA